MSNNLLLARSSLGRTPLIVDNGGALTVSDSTVVSAVNDLGASLSNIDINTDTLEAKMDTINTTLTTETVNVLPQVSSYGSYANLSNSASLVVNASSSSVDISNLNYANLFYTDDNYESNNPVRVQVSTDDTNWMTYAEIYPFAVGNETTRSASLTDMNTRGLNNIRITNSSGPALAGVIASVVGTN